MDNFTNIVNFTVVCVAVLFAQFLWGPSQIVTYVYKRGGTSFPELDHKYNRWQRGRLGIAGAGLFASLSTPWMFESHYVWLGVLGVSMTAMFVLDLLKLLSLVDDLDGR